MRLAFMDSCIGTEDKEIRGIWRLYVDNLPDKGGMADER
jgi:hypothetical protein